jgi:hypothetical protein
MPNQFNDLNQEEQDKRYSYLEKFWPMAEELKISGLKINEAEKLVESSLMGFLPPEECLEKIKRMFEIHPEKGEELAEKTNSGIFTPLKNELSKMYEEKPTPEVKEEPQIKKPPKKTLGEELGLSK